MSIPPYPLVWPEGLARTPRPISGSFKTSLAAAVVNVEDSLRRFASDSGLAVKNVSVTSMKAGLSNAQPKDVGVAIWFEWDGQQRCIAVDRYDKLEHNVQAIHHIIEARRTELRHGGLRVVQQTFTGFVALPAPPRKPWREVMGFGSKEAVGAKDIAERFRQLSRTHHPDANQGSAEKFHQLTVARDEALAAIQGA